MATDTESEPEPGFYWGPGRRGTSSNLLKELRQGHKASSPVRDTKQAVMAGASYTAQSVKGIQYPEISQHI